MEYVLICCIAVTPMLFVAYRELDIGVFLRRWWRGQSALQVVPPLTDSLFYSAPKASLEPGQHFRFPLFEQLRGAVRTTRQGAQALIAPAADAASYLIAGVTWPVKDYLNLTSLIIGKPKSGKTTLLKIKMRTLAVRFSTPGFRMRWVVLDPTNAFLPFLYQILPVNVRIIRAAPHDRRCSRWAVARDVTDRATAMAFVKGLVTDEMKAGSKDPFWYRKSEELLLGVVTAFLYHKSHWEFSDLIVAIKYQQFLIPLLESCPETAGIATETLKQRIGSDVFNTVSAVLDSMSVAAAMWQRATSEFSLADLDEPGVVLHFAYTPKFVPCELGVANAMTNLLVKSWSEKTDPENYLHIFVDEAAFAGGASGGLISGIEDAAVRGRGAGIGLTLTIQSTVQWEHRIGKDTVEGLFDVADSVTCLAAGPYTAEAFSRFCGEVEGLALSGSHGYTIDSRDKLVPGGAEARDAIKDEDWDLRALHSVALEMLKPYGSGFHHDKETGYRNRMNSTHCHHTIDLRDELDRGLVELHAVHRYQELYHSIAGVYPGQHPFIHGESWGLQTKRTVLAGELTNLPLANPFRDLLCGYHSNTLTGTYYFQVPFRSHSEGLPPVPDGVEVEPRDADDQFLRPWDGDDIRRLRLPVSKALSDAVHAYKKKPPTP